MLSPAQSCKLVHVSGAHGHMLVCITCSGCGFVYFTVQYYKEYSSTVSLFQAQDVRNKHKSSSDLKKKKAAVM